MTTAQRTARLQAIDIEQRNIEDSAERNNGGKFSDEQRRRYDALNAEHAELSRNHSSAGSQPLPRRTAVDSASRLPTETQATQPQPRNRWLNLATGQPVQVYASNERISDSYRSEQDVSFGRFVRAIITGNWRGAEAEKMLLSESGAGGGHFLVPEILSARWIDAARAQSALFRAGMQTVDMTSETLRIARLATDPTFEVKAENVAFTGSDVTFDAVELTARTIGTVITLSREVAEDAPNAGEIVEDVLARALAVSIDARCLVGNGGGDGVLGLVLFSGVGSTSSVGAIAWEDFHNAAVGVRESNYEPNAVILHPTIYGDAQILTSGDGTNSAKLWLGPPPSVANLEWLPTTSATTAYSVVGDFTHALFGMRTGAQLEVSNIADNAFNKHQVKVKITQRFDFAVSQPAAFHVLSGITT